MQEPGIPYYPLIVAPVAVAAFFFWRRARRHVEILRAGRSLNRFDQPLRRIWGFGVYVIGQKRLLQDPAPGLMHAAIFWGFLSLLVTTGNYFTNGLVEAILSWPFGGVLWALAVALANLFIGLVLLTELAGDALRFVAQPGDPARDWALLATPLAGVLEPIGPDAATTWYGVFAWAHIGLVLVFGTYLPYSKHLHILTSEPNVYFRNLEPRGALRKMDLEAEPVDGVEPTFGAKALKDLTWRHLLDPMSCTECGRCMEFCPASMTGKTLSPKHFMEGLRDQIPLAATALAAAASAQRAAKGGADGGMEASDAALSLARDRAEEALSLPLVDNAIPEEAIWQCTTCGWCVEGCPVLIEHVDSIVEIRRNLVLEQGSNPKELNTAFRNMETAGNPWGQPKSARLDWAEGLDVPVLSQTDARVRANGNGGDGAAAPGARWRTIHESAPSGDS